MKIFQETTSTAGTSQIVYSYINEPTINDCVIVYYDDGDITKYGYAIYHTWYKFVQVKNIHNEEGPAIIQYDKLGNVKFEWWIDNINITEQVTIWLKENNINWSFRPYSKWSEEEKFAFKMQFV